MRSLRKSWIGIGLAILFGASLFFFKGASRYSNLFNSDNFVGNVSGTQISTTQFLRSLEMNIGQFSQMIGEQLSGDQIKSFQIHQLVLQNLVNNAIFENEFDKLNFILDDSIVAENTKRRFPNLYLNNKINDDELNNFLRLQRLKIEDLVNIINYETRSNVFDNLFFEQNYPNEFTRKINLINNQTRSIDLLKVPYEKIFLPDLNESSLNKENIELINFFEKNSLNYMSEEKRDISYVMIDKNLYKNKFTPNDNEIINYFNDNKNLFIIPETRSFKQFNFKTIKEAENFKLELSGMSKDKILELAENKNIVFNEFKKVNSFQVLDELSDVIFSMQVDEVSNIVSTTLANHIIILDEIVKERQPPLEEVSEKIKSTLTDVQLNNFFNDLKLKINQQIIDGLALSELAEKNNLDLKNINNTIMDNSDKTNIKTSIINFAFSQNKDFVSDIVEFDDNISFIINVDQIYPSKVKNIELIFDDLVSDYLRLKKQEFAKVTLENLIPKSDFNKIRSIFNLETEQLNIKSDYDNLPLSLTKNIFDDELDSIVFSSDNDNVYFAKVIDIVIPGENNMPQDISIFSELKNSFGNEIIKTKKISFNNELIDGLLSQYK